MHGASLLTRGALEYIIAQRPSVTVLCMLYKIMSKLVLPLYGALSVPYVSVPVTRSILVAHWYTYEPPCCKTSQYHMTFIPLAVSLWKGHGGHVFDGVGLAGFKSRAEAF